MRLQLLLRVSVFCYVSVCVSMQNVTELHIGTLIPGLSNRHDVFGFMTAIELAAETINNQSLLRGYKLVFHHKDTFTLPAKAMEYLFEFRNDNSPAAVKICILGPSSSKIAMNTAPLATIWGPLQVSYGAANLELLSDAYPRFLSVVPSANSLNKALIALMKYFSWKRVSLTYDVQNKEFYLPTMNALKDVLVTHKMELLIQEGINLKKADDKKLFVQNLKEKDVRIVIALFHNDNFIQTMCEAYKQGVYGDKIVWITYLDPLRFDTKKSRFYGCNESEFMVVSEGTFNLDIQYLRTDKNKTISGLTAEEFKRKFHARRTRLPLGVPRYPIAFDTTWLLALSLNASLQDASEMQAINPRRKKNKYFELTEKLRKRMTSLNFEGISGRVVFNSSERLGIIVIKQQRKGCLVNVAEHHTASNVLTFFPNQSKPEVLFKGTRYLQDGPCHINQPRHYSLVMFIVIWIVCSLAMIIALALFYFNFKNREIRYIKMSSPHVNNIIIFGGLLCYIKVILDTLDSRFIGLETYGRICNVRVWMMSLGFTTAFGAMFSKTWRVHRIFTASKNFRRAVIKNFHLYGLLFALLVVDCMILTVWMGVSPYQSGILQLPNEENKEEDTVIHPYIFNCTSKYESYFLITTLGCKGLLLVFGIFLAWETRNIEIKALNDSKYIGISVYNVVILSVVGVILATIMRRTEYYNVYLALMSVVVITCTAATLGIVFVPKIIGLRRIVNSTTNNSLETTYSVKSSGDHEAPCCCCEECKCKCSGPGRKASIHVSNKFLAGSSSNNRKKSRTGSAPTISVTKPNVSVHINARVSLSSYPIRESPAASPDESPRVGFLSSVNEA